MRNNKNNKKGKRVDKRVVEIERSDSVVVSLNKSNVKLSATVKIAEKSSQKRGHKNILLENIRFRHNGIQYKIGHCWLQEKDYPKGMYNDVRENTEVEVEFIFYPYTDASDRGMHGMTISVYHKHYDLGLLF